MYQCLPLGLMIGRRTLSLHFLFTVHCRLRAFDSGVLVIQSLSHNDEEVIRTTKQIVSMSTQCFILVTGVLLYV